MNTPGDAHEQEADRVADQVLAASANQADGTPPPRIGRFTGPSSGQPGIASASADRVLASPGKPLDPGLQQDMERRFGYDFSRVRVHFGAAAGQSASELNAAAYTVGHNIVFNTSQFAPGTHGGRRLLAHELSHVVQQGVGPRLIQRDEPTDAEKAEAEKKTKLIAALVSDYALASVADDTGSWTSAHLQQVSDAFKLLPAGDKKALKGVTLSRVTSLGGKTAGRFESSQSVTGTTVVNEATVELADLAFKDGAPASYSVIVHEVGHAVATLPLRTAVHAEHIATAESNRLVEISNPTVDAYNAAVQASNATVAPYNDAVTEYNAANKSGDAGRIAAAKTDYHTKKADYDAKTAETVRLRGLMNTAKANTAKALAATKKKKAAAKKKRIAASDLIKVKTSAESAAAAHKKSVDAAKSNATALSDEAKTESTAYQSALDAAGVAIADFTAKTKDQQLSEDDVETAIAEAQKQLDSRDTQRKALTDVNKDNAALAIYSSVEQAQDDWFEAAKAHSLAHERSARVQKFVNFVESNSIPPITTYAAENWPHNPKEFYAEAYSMYLAKPNDLKAASALLYNWFKGNKY